MRRITAVTAQITLAILLVIYLTPVTGWWARALAGDWSDANGPTLIVLSADLERDGILGYTSYLRTMYAVRAYREHPFQKIIVTGGIPRGASVSAAAAMRDFLIGNGVPAAIIAVEDKATSTRENALFVKPLLDPGTRPILMTSDFHMFRARHVFEKAGIHVIGRPIPDVLKRYNNIANRFLCFGILSLETAKTGYYAVRGWL